MLVTTKMPIFSYSLGLTDARSKEAAELYAKATKEAIERGDWSAAHNGFGSTLNTVVNSCAGCNVYDIRTVTGYDDA